MENQKYLLYKGRDFKQKTIFGMPYMVFLTVLFDFNFCWTKYVYILSVVEVNIFDFIYNKVQALSTIKIGVVKNNIHCMGRVIGTSS